MATKGSGGSREREAHRVGFGARSERGEARGPHAQGGTPPPVSSPKPGDGLNPPALGSPAGAVPAGKAALGRNAGSAETGDVHRQPRPTRAGPTGRPLPRKGREGRERGGRRARQGFSSCRKRAPVGTGALSATARKNPGESALRGTKAGEGLRRTPTAGTRASPIDGKATLRQA